MIILNGVRIFGRDVTFHASSMFNYQRKKRENMYVYVQFCLFYTSDDNGILWAPSVVSGTSEMMLG